MSGLYLPRIGLKAGGVLLVFVKYSPLHKRPHDSRRLARLLYEETLLRPSPTLPTKGGGSEGV